MRETQHLEKIILALKSGLTLTRFVPLMKALPKEGISVEVFLTEELQENLPQGDCTLVITDSGETASVVKRSGIAVLGFRHEEEESFAGIEYLCECPEEIDARYLERVYRRCHKIPWEILETERCVLRETIEEDVDSFFEIYHHPDIVKYTENLYPEKEQEKSYIREYIEKVYRYFEFGVWTVLWKETGEVIGRAGFSVREGYELPELGFVIAVPWQGKGVAYEICSAILQYGREEYEFDRVQALVMPENAVSIALCRKLGFAERQRVTEKDEEYILFTIENPAAVSNVI